MANNSGGIAAAEEEPLEAALVFREQADGRRVARLPGGKVVLIDLGALERVQDGEKWRVRLRHRETFAIAEPVERIQDLFHPVIPETIGETFARSATALRSIATVVSPLPAPKEAPGPTPEAPARVPAAPATHERPRDAEPVTGAPARSTEGVSTVLLPALDPGRVLRPDDRVAIFVDGANMDGACRSAGYFVDYRKAREFVVAGAMFVAGYYYIADFTASDPLQQRFMDFLARSGFIVRRRPVKVIKDYETGERTIKGNLDTEIVLDMLNTVENYDVAFLFSGDSDFERAIDLLRSRGKRVYLVTSRQALSRELMYVADKPIFFLEDLRPTLIRDTRANS